MRRTVISFFLLVGISSLIAQDYKECVENAMNAMKQDSLKLAEEWLLNALEADAAKTSNAILYHYLGQIQEKQGRDKEALNSYGMGLNIQPTSQRILFSRASLLLRLENHAGALDDYNKILEESPNHIESLLFRAYIYTVQHAYRLARADYENLLKIDPAHRNARLGLILLNDKDGRPQEAMNQMNLLISLFPQDAELYIVRAGMEEKRLQYELAELDYNKAIELQPTTPEHYIARGSFYESIKKRKSAKADFRKAGALSSGSGLAPR